MVRGGLIITKLADKIRCNRELIEHAVQRRERLRKTEVKSGGHRGRYQRILTPRSTVTGKAATDGGVGPLSRRRGGAQRKEGNDDRKKRLQRPRARGQ